MFVRRLLICFALLLVHVQSALATPACEGVDTVLETVSILRSAEILQGDLEYSNTISRLENTLSLTSLSTLQPETYRGAFPDESRALFVYISNLRRAVSSAQEGYDDVAKEILKNTNPALISESLLTLNRYWNCTNSEVASNTEGPPSDESVFEKGQGLPSDAPADTASTASLSSEAPTNEKANTRTLAKSISNGPKLDIQGHPFLSIAMALSLIALIYGWRKYSKRSRARDHRHLIHQDTKFKIGKNYYQMTVIDITQKGLKFKHDGYLGKRAKLSLELDGAWHSCRLQWKNANFAGAKFKSPLKDKTMDAILAATHQPYDKTPKTARPA